MARIRSTHPGQWTDEDFVACSPFARLLVLALRNEADDNGVFEWKPLALKMRLLPADHVDVAVLLDELSANRQVASFEVSGKRYGVIRNFRRWQRPEKPKSWLPIPDEWRAYAGLVAERIPPDTPAVADQSSSGRDESSKVPAEVGGRREDVGGGMGCGSGVANTKPPLINQESSHLPREERPDSQRDLGDRNPGNATQSPHDERRSEAQQAAWFNAACVEAKRRLPAAEAEALIAGSMDGDAKAKAAIEKLWRSRERGAAA